MTPLPTIEQIQLALTHPRPGMAAWVRMMPRPRNIIPPPDANPREAGVLILLYPWDETTYLVLTRRSEGLATHKGQISLPGGGLKSGETPYQAALREAHEELGVPLDAMTVLGELTPLYIPPSNYIIHPVVACAAQRPVFTPDPREVADVLEVPLSALLASDVIIEETWELRGEQVQVPFYRIGGAKVWGATAMVLSEFTTLLETALNETP